MTRLILSTVWLFSIPAFSQTWNVADTQARRSSERFDIISWVRGNQALIDRQNAKYGRASGGRGATLDIVLKFNADSGTVSRTGVSTLGTDTRAGGKVQVLLDDLFTRGTRKMSLNIDLGGEFFASQTTNFSVNNGVTQATHLYTETGGGMVIRPFGRSSQDTGLLVKGGYVSINEMGLWSNTTTQTLLYGPYLGAEAKLYLLPFMGIFADYQAVLQSSNGPLQGQWNMQRFMYGAYIEVFLLQLSGYITNTQMTLTPTSTNTANNENYTGYGAGASLFF